MRSDTGLQERGQVNTPTPLLSASEAAASSSLSCRNAQNICLKAELVRLHSRTQYKFYNRRIHRTRQRRFGILRSCVPRLGVEFLHTSNRGRSLLIQRMLDNASVSLEMKSIIRTAAITYSSVTLGVQSSTQSTQTKYRLAYSATCVFSRNSEEMSYPQRS